MRPVLLILPLLIIWFWHRFFIELLLFAVGFCTLTFFLFPFDALFFFLLAFFADLFFFFQIFFLIPKRRLLIVVHGYGIVGKAIKMSILCKCGTTCQCSGNICPRCGSTMSSLS